MTERAATLQEMAGAIRALTMDAVKAAKSGHSGMPMGMADVATVLYSNYMRVDPSAPSWPDRDRFVLSAGHGSMMIYALNHLLGYEDMPIEQIKNFRQLGYSTAGHPEYGHAAGIETTTGPLGQGLANSVGMAMAERALNARFGDGLVQHHTYVMTGDGCLMEGVSHEAIDMAGHLRLGNLIVFWDDNKITIDGAVSLASSTDQPARFEAAGWHVQRIDGHDHAEIAAAIEAAQADPRPSMIACATTIGFGAPKLAGTAKAHGAILDDDEIQGARAALGWPYPPFEIPEQILAAWRALPARSKELRTAWEARLAASEHRAPFEAAISGAVPLELSTEINKLKAQHSADKPKLATRASAQKALAVVNAVTPNTLGGSADLTGSNNTRTEGMTPFTAEDYSGNYVFYGVREHGMSAAMNGVALHGGLIPYGGAFLVFSDYARPTIRLSALMGVRVVYVFTHDSIGVGEDGPTHQPVEHLAALRAIPNLAVFRPADAVEAAEAWEAALQLDKTPSVLALTRQGLTTVRTEHTEENLVAKGAYVLREADGPRALTLLATGSEVEIALAAADALKTDGIAAAVVSMPCWRLFEQQPAEYRAAVLGSAPRVGVEAAVKLGWERWIGDQGAFVGMDSFGASAPAGELYAHFGITAEAVAMAARGVVSA